MTERFVVVKGEGQYTEAVEHFLIDVSIRVRAPKQDSALEQAREHGARALEVLCGAEAGLDRSEVMSGGLDTERPWGRRKKSVGVEAIQKLVVRTKNLGVAARMLCEVETVIADGKRVFVEINNRKPEFHSTAEARLEALEQAVNDARAKAERMAAALGAKIGSAIRIEEGGEVKRSSGFGEDDDWWGDSGRFSGGGFDPALHLLAGAGGAAEPTGELDDLEAPTRTIWVKCRVRFALEG